MAYNSNLLSQAAALKPSEAKTDSRIENVESQEKAVSRIDDINEYLSGPPPLEKRADALAELMQLSQMVQTARSVLLTPTERDESEVLEQTKNKEQRIENDTRDISKNRKRINR